MLDYNIIVELNYEHSTIVYIQLSLSLSLSLVAVCNLIHKFTEQLCLRRRTLEGIAIVRTAIERYSPKPTTLTAIHCDLIQVHTHTHTHTHTVTHTKAAVS